jgi:hypothetical protein
MERNEWIQLCHSILEDFVSACSFSWWLVADVDLFWEKSIAAYLLVAGLFRERQDMRMDSESAKKEDGIK